MPEFLVETYASRDGAGDVADASRRAREAVEALAHEGVAVRLLRTLFVSEDETCFYLYEAETVDVVVTAATLAELRFDRVTEATAPDLAGRQE